MFIDTFIEFLRSERNYSLHTIRAYKTDLRSFEEYLIGVDAALSVQNADADLVRGWVSSLIDEGGSPNSVNRKLSTLRTFYDFLRNENVVEQNPLQGLNGPKRRSVLPVFLKDGEVNSVIDSQRYSDSFLDVRDKVILLSFYETGIRLSELVGLNVSDVDFSNKQLKVFGKRKRERVVPFVNELSEELAFYISERNQIAPADEKALFVSINGERLSASQVYRIVNKRLSGVVNVNKKSPHVLRHTYATSMLNNDAELGAVKELLGHKRLATTEIYTHLTFEELKHYYKKAHPRAGN
ncbi:MAG: tyrosine-type recombinase/integrase [Bacteroidaceae bacterium]|nr:tyrosine-type recombinase/integrase [Bacteroidaceae bacterium]